MMIREVFKKRFKMKKRLSLEKAEIFKIIMSAKQEEKKYNLLICISSMFIVYFCISPQIK
jgi:hypothetical protein